MGAAVLSGLRNASLNAGRAECPARIRRTPPACRQTPVPLGVVRSSASLKETKPTFSATSSCNVLDEIDERPPPAVEPPDDDDINLFPAGGAEQFFSAGTCRGAGTDFFDL